jgi:UDP-N-acetylmuramoyl-L-alanyl-D-glutamate--2,6-diaminopimelate ligase
MDSRQVSVGNLFVAIQGEKSDGHCYIEAAIQRGAAVIVGTRPLSGLAVPYLQVSDGREALAHLAAAFYGFPARGLTVIGVTGTDGKTTTANLIYHILRTAGLRAGMISTVNAVIGDQVLDTGFHVTTPEAPDVQRYLAQMRAAGLEYVILEATSHGLAQKRLAACDVDMAVVTNITHEHLDYHQTYTAYREAKGTLFARLAETPPKAGNPPRGAALNRDDASYEYLAAITQAPCLSYGFGEDASVRAVDVRLEKDGSYFTVLGKDLQRRAFEMQVASPLVGEFNVYNLLAAICLARGVMGLEAGQVAKSLVSAQAVEGRMERLDLGQNFLAIVDFAHTPNALRNALETACRLAPGRVIAVFGSAGLRDRAKRRMMAEVSAELADLSVLTAEDPRTESLEAILAEMAAGARARGGVEGQTFWRIPDRRQAIRYGLRQAKQGDVVIVCGKGHEQSMCFGEVEYPWDDRVAVRAALAELLGIPGPEMPFLPA